jgi:broad specificity polyphosphatase/5'/3'-nucleotidase SurE
MQSITRTKFVGACEIDGVTHYVAKSVNNTKCHWSSVPQNAYAVCTELVARNDAEILVRDVNAPVREDRIKNLRIVKLTIQEDFHSSLNITRAALFELLTNADQDVKTAMDDLNAIYKHSDWGRLGSMAGILQKTIAARAEIAEKLENY